MNVYYNRVPKNGYYFFVYGSENEVEDNFIRVQFKLEKTRYDVSKPIKQCNNTTGLCQFPLNFWSDEKVVFEMPLTEHSKLGRDEYTVRSECEPRTIIYVICVISVPLLILLFAFQ